MPLTHDIGVRIPYPLPEAIGDGRFFRCSRIGPAAGGDEGPGVRAVRAVRAVRTVRAKRAGAFCRAGGIGGMCGALPSCEGLSRVQCACSLFITESDCLRSRFFCVACRPAAAPQFFRNAVQGLAATERSARRLRGAPRGVLSGAGCVGCCGPHSAELYPASGRRVLRIACCGVSSGAGGGRSEDPPLRTLPQAELCKTPRGSGSLPRVPAGAACTARSGLARICPVHPVFPLRQQ